MYTVTKIEMHQMTPSWTWTLNNQQYSIYTKYLPWDPNFGPFRSTISRFRDTYTTLAKIGNAQNNLKLNLNT